MIPDYLASPACYKSYVRTLGCALLVFALQPVIALAEEFAPVLGPIEVTPYTSDWVFSFDALAFRPDGGFVVAWHRGTLYPDEIDVFAKVFDDAGVAGDPFQINTYETGRQWEPSVAVDDEGGFIVVWGAYTSADPDQGVSAQRFDSAAQRMGTEFQVNVVTEGWQFVPHVDTTPAGGFVVVWDTGGGYLAPFEQVYGRRYDTAGMPEGSEFALAQTLEGDGPDGARLSINDSGRTLVTWSRDQGGDAKYDVFARAYGSDGMPLGSEFQVNTYTTDTQWAQSSTVLGDGTFIVTWTSWGAQDGSGIGIVARAFDSTGAALGTEFQVNSYTTNNQYNSAIASVGGDKFIVAWTGSALGGDGVDVAARVFDAAGNPLTGDFLVNEPSNPIGINLTTTTTVCDPFLVSRAVSAAQRRRPAAQLLTTSTTLDPCAPVIPGELLGSVAGHESGRFVVSWNGDYRVEPQVFIKRFTLSPHCGDADDDGEHDTSDALHVLRAAVGTTSCAGCICDVSGSGTVTAADALTVLRHATDQSVNLQCSSCAS